VVFWDDKTIHVWGGTFTEPVTRDYRVSICTTCMGRAHDVKVTLPKNLADNADYANVEFVILDYNSPDDLEDWMRRNMREQIESGRVAYYKTTEPTCYSMCHSRNVAFLAATGEVVNNVDADNWTGAGFAAYVNRLANQQPRRAVFAKGRRNLRGRIGFWRDEFIDLLGGYDERFVGRGPDDRDLFNRAVLHGFTLMWFGGGYGTRLLTDRAGDLLLRNYADKHRTGTEKRNERLSKESLSRGESRANAGRRWGAARLVKNFREEIEVGQ